MGVRQNLLTICRNRILRGGGDNIQNLSMFSNGSSITFFIMIPLIPSIILAAIIAPILGDFLIRKFNIK